MIRMRKTDGTTTVLRDEFKFVEICDKEGRVAELIVDNGDGSLKKINGPDEEAERYKSLFGVEFCPVRDLPS